MSTKYVRSLRWVGTTAILLSCSLPALGQDAAFGAAVSVTPAGDVEASAYGEGDLTGSVSLGTTGAGVTDAEEYFRRGVALYKRDLYREALTEFNRALALNPNLAAARDFEQKAQAKLQMAAAGSDPSATPVFETFDPESIAPGQRSAPLTPDELRRERVRSLLSDAKRYMDHQRYDVGVQIYEQVLLLDPRNQTAIEGLHEATLGASRNAVVESERRVEEDKQRIREFIWDKKQLPEGADASGIKPYRLSFPEIEEQFISEPELSKVEQTLQSPVNIEFEDIHINDIIGFVADSYGINIVIDTRAVDPPTLVQEQQQAGPGGPGAPFPGGPGAPGAFGAQQQARPQTLAGLAAQQQGGFQGGQFGVQGAQLGGTDYFYGPKSDGKVPYISLRDVTLAEALQALLRPLGLDYSIQPGFVWVSRPEIIARETFERVETRFYELRNLGAETMYKVVLRNRFGVTSGGGGGGFGGGGGQFGGGGGQFGGGGFGGGGGQFGGGGGQFGGGGGQFGGGGFGGGGGQFGGGGGQFGGGMGGGQFGGGGGQFGGGMGGGQFGGGGFGGGGGQFGGGGMGGGMGQDVTSLSNISDLFSNINDQMVGEPLAIPGAVGLNSIGTGAGRNGRNAQQIRGGGLQGGQFGQQATLGGAGQTDVTGTVLEQLSILIPEIYAPYSDEPLSDMFYNPANNMLIVKNTPSNLEDFEKKLAQVDVTPKQVSIEARFLTIRVQDLDKIGFQWNATLSDQNNRRREIAGLPPYAFDINGDGVDEAIPFWTRPDGSNVVRNTITEGILDALVNPGPSASTFSLAGTILDNADGDTLGLTFDYLDSIDETELLSAPRVTTMNRKPAVIADFSTEYFVSSIDTMVTTTQGSTLGGTPTTAFTQRVNPVPFNFGISLSVTPQIRDNDQVRLWLNPEVRTRTGEKTFTQRQVVGSESFDNDLILPTTSWQAVWTNVIVNDGDTLVLGGLVQDQTIKGEQRMPYLADLPLIGFFFRGKSREVSQSSLLIFVTPDIIDTSGARFFGMAGV